jgi:hypothetical protein
MRIFISGMICMLATLALAEPREFVAAVPWPQQLEIQKSNFELTPGEIGLRFAGVDRAACADL